MMNESYPPESIDPPTTFEEARQNIFNEIYNSGCDYDAGCHAYIYVRKKIREDCLTEDGLCKTCATKANVAINNLMKFVEVKNGNS